MMQSPHVASKRIASKASLLGLAFVAAALAAAQSTPKQSQPDALELLRNVEATYAAVGTYSTKSTHVIEMNGPSMQNKMETTETTTADSSGRFRRESTGLMGMVMVFDGSTMWTYMPQMNKYSRISLDQLKAKLQSLGHAHQYQGNDEIGKHLLGWACLPGLVHVYAARRGNRNGLVKRARDVQGDEAKWLPA